MLESHVLLFKAIDCYLIVTVLECDLGQHILLFFGLKLMDLRLVCIGLLLEIVFMVLCQGLRCKELVIIVLLGRAKTSSRIWNFGGQEFLIRWWASLNRSSAPIAIKWQDLGTALCSMLVLSLRNFVFIFVVLNWWGFLRESYISSRWLIILVTTLNIWWFENPVEQVFDLLVSGAGLWAFGVIAGVIRHS